MQRGERNILKVHGEKVFEKPNSTLSHGVNSQPGEYFITICIHNHECISGGIEDGEMRLNEIGKIEEKEWLRTSNVRPRIELDLFVIMPNHMHGIIVIKEGLPIVGTHSCASLQRKPRSLGSIIAGFKSAATKRINEMRHAPSIPVWQKKFYDRIIRSENELNRIRDYIYPVRNTDY